ncbi:Transcriptional regulator, AraC family [Labilithrix luteola]|uniref:Transcriptional regulator, AraC family n=1 Tax=Labilithrix luteola TaxID=1391654 RepID=A0A0K1Q675_9BACT|nr:AraC family transcriptional regulator [Labilithrix luteola]AKV00915.1 Transcriptional regulator, AraC family [Labilithrix luteola]
MRRTVAPLAHTARELGRLVFVWGARMLYVGPLVAASRHAHHAAQILVAPGGVEVEDGVGGRIRARAAVIPPRVTHGHGACTHGAILFLDGDDASSRELARHAEPRCETWRRDTLDVTVPRDPTPEQARALIRSILSAVALRQPPKPRHPATRRMTAYLDGSDHADLASLSHAAGLSPRQMRHAFARDVGLPMRAYLRWKRLRRALAAVEQGASLSVAAASAGFADSAHLSRVFREQFGMTPTQGLRSVRWLTLE